MKKITHLLLVTSLLPATVFAAEGEYRYERKYKAGQKFGYTYERRESINGNLMTSARGQTQHEAIKDTAAPAPGSSAPPPVAVANENIKWVSFKQAFEVGRVVDSTDAVKKLSVIQLSLPAVAAPVVPTFPPELGQTMNELMQSYQTFNPEVLAKLKKVGDKVTNPPRYATWGNARVGRSGAQCVAETTELTALDAEKAVFRRSQLPSKACKELKFPVSGMSTPLVPDTVNGMYFLEREGPKLSMGWGSYETVYVIEVSRVDGRPLRMQIKNSSFSTNRTECDSNFRNCKMPSDGLMERVSRSERVSVFTAN